MTILSRCEDTEGFSTASVLLLGIPHSMKKLRISKRYIEFKRIPRSHEVISQGGFTNFMNFLMKYPDFVNYKAPRLLKLMINLQDEEGRTSSVKATVYCLRT